MADHATDDMAFTNLIKQILKDLVHQLSEVSRAIIQFFAHFLVEPKTEWDFQTKHDFYTHMETQDLRTLQGERVKSYEELQIANWLYENGIEYEYEPVYEHKITETGRRDYQPDFRLVESGIYIEHFGVRREKARDGSERLVTEFVLMTEERPILDVVAIDVRELAFGSGIPAGIDAIIPIEPHWKQRSSQAPLHEAV